MSDVPATAGYSGGGATVINDNIDRKSPGNVVAEHLTHNQDKNACCKGIHAAHGGAGGPSEHELGAGSHTDAPTRGERGPIDLDNTQAKSHAVTGAQGAGSQGTQGSVLGAGPNAPVNVTPIPGQTQSAGAEQKAQVKTATAVAGVQEDLKGLRDRLTANQDKDACCKGIHAAHGGAGGPSDHEMGAGAEGGAKPGMGERIKDFGVKVIDHTQAALEGAKQKVTKQTTQPASTAPES